MSKKTIFVIFILTIVGGFTFAQTAAQIVERSRNRIQADTVRTQSRMIISARGGGTTERIIEQNSKKDAQGNNRTLIIFHEPETVRGTRFLTIENPDRDNDQWIFLPGPSRVRRIVAGEGSGSFVGTDFSYDDISSADRRADLDNHSILREEQFQGRGCYVIESIPKDTNYQYSKMIQWIDKDTFVTHKVELYDRRGVHVKLLEILELREVQGRLAIMVTRMSTLAAGTSTSLNVTALQYDRPIPEGVFTTNFLETGRP